MMNQCPSCFRTVPADAPGNLCPSCLLQQAISDVDSDADNTSGPGGPVNAGTELNSGETIGGFTVTEKLGSGGFGTVYKASQKSPVRRTVAIKILNAGMDTREFINRFQGERQALARMDHPGIAKMLDAGSTRLGRPYFVMEYVPGSPLTRFADENQLNLRQRLELFRDVCAAVGHAHTKAIIHRDIKASNVLAYNRDGRSAIKVIDFGIAKAISGDQLSDQTLNTGQGRAVGTYDTMSPEQAAGSADIDTRTDVYSLGVLLYELLAGCKPFVWPSNGMGSADEIRRMIRDVEPPRPSTRVTSGEVATSDIARYRKTNPARLVADLRTELEWIPLKAMRKNRAERYASAAELDADIVRYLDGRPLVAGPDSFSYTAAKFVRRNVGVLVSVCLVALVLFGGILAYISGIRGERQRADDARLAAEQQRQLAQTAEIAAEAARNEQVLARRDAEREAVNATRAAARSEARYLTQEYLLPAAFARAKDAWALGGEWEDGFTIDQIAKVAQRSWRLNRRIAAPDVSCACFAGRDAHEYLIVGRGDGIAEVDLSDGKPLATAAHGSDHAPLLKIISNTALGSVTTVREASIDRFELPGLKQVATRHFDRTIRFATANDKQLLLIDDAGDARVVSLVDFSDLAALPFADQSAVNGANLARPVLGAISPSGNQIVLHGGPWHRPWTFWNRSGAQPAISPADFRASQLQFIEDGKALAWFVSDIHGAYPSELSHYALGSSRGSGNQWERTSTQGIPDEDVKAEIELHAWKSGQAEAYALVGKAGCISLVGDSDWSDDRYENLLPGESHQPSYLCASFESARLALQQGDEILIFDRRSQSFGREVTDFSECSFASGQLTIHGGFDPSVELHLAPFDAARPKRVFHLQWISGTAQMPRSLPWAMCATPSGSVLVVIVQETEYADTIGTAYGKVRALIYRNPQGLNSAPDALSLDKVIDLDTVPCGNWEKRFAAVDPSGEILTYLTASAGGARYSLSDGRRLSAIPLTAISNHSDDGRYVAGIDSTGGALSTFDVATGGLVFSVPSQADTTGVCVSRDDTRVVCSNREQVRAFAIPSGKLLSEFRSNLVPLAYPGGETNRFVAFQADTEGGSGNIVLADTSDGRVVTVIARAGSTFCPVSFSPDGRAIAVLLQRWRADVYRSMTPDQFSTVLAGTGPGIGSAVTAADAAELPPIAPPVPATAPTTGTANGTDVAELLPKIGQVVTIKGIVKYTSWTVAHTAINIEFDGPEDVRTMCWISPAYLESFLKAFGADFATTVVGREITVTGRLSRYGGHRSEWRQRLQITLLNPVQLTISPQKP